MRYTSKIHMKYTKYIKCINNRRAARWYGAVGWLAILLVLTPSTVADVIKPRPPHVVVSIAPIHSLVAAVMQGVGEPQLLLAAEQSPHLTTLTPSRVRALQRADLVVWVGGGFEHALARNIHARRAPVMTIGEQSRLTHYARAPHTPRDPTDVNATAPVAPHARDPHLWLSTTNAQRIVQLVAEQLAVIDVANAATYQANARVAAADIAQLRAELAHRLRPVADHPYLVLHDAYQYFEREFEPEFSLNHQATIARSVEQPPSAKHISALRARIRTHKIQCIFHEPQFAARLLTVVTDDTELRAGILDPLGIDLKPGPTLWFTLMTNLADAFVACLGDSS